MPKTDPLQIVFTAGGAAVGALLGYEIVFGVFRAAAILFTLLGTISAAALGAILGFLVYWLIIGRKSAS
jgi:hypothetical protein